MASGDSNSCLHNAIAITLRQNPPPIEYEKVGVLHVVRVRVGKVCWQSDPCYTEQQAQQSASAKALASVRDMPETRLRQSIGLPPRVHVKQLDEVRDQLKVIKRRVKAVGSGQKQVAALCAVGQFYGHMNRLEDQLIGAGVCD